MDVADANRLESGVENEIVGEALVALRHEELKEMAIMSVGHRLTILKGVYDIKIEHGVPVEQDDYIPPCSSGNPSHRWTQTLTVPSC